jgi:alkanesulfonate monooxygenase SsuD/methylene tetrahydromethanopterin reductase-like flavin-dependent oxidoreductase (luciferase family)
VHLTALDLVTHARDTLAIAPAIEALGYDRLWIADHPPQPTPEIVVGLLAGMTDTIRIGTAGILLRYRAPLQVAQNLLVLNDLFPGRIDAGVCAGAVGSELQGWTESDDGDFAAKARLLARALRDPVPETKARRLRGYGKAVQEIWTFGGSARSALLAAELGMAFGYSLFHATSKDDTAPFQAYRDSFVAAAAGLPSAYAALAIAGVLADDAEDAARIRARFRNSFLAPNLVGTAEQCRPAVQDLYRRFRPDAMVFLDLCNGAEEKLRSYEIFRDICRSLSG